jgi:serine/threonine protein kinase
MIDNVSRRLIPQPGLPLTVIREEPLAQAEPLTEEFTGPVHDGVNAPIEIGITLNGDDGQSFKLIEFINSGGMANVYKARNNQGEIVAVKILKNWTVTMLRDRFEKETALMAELRSYRGVIP